MLASKGAVALSVGGTKGIGRGTAIELARLGTHVVVVGRDTSAGSELERELENVGGSGHFIQADMSLMQETRRVAEMFLAQYDRLDLLIQSADVLLFKREETAEGLELGFATNYLSRFLLNSLLLDTLKRSAPARILHIAAPGLPGGLNVENVPPPANMSAFSAHNLGQKANDVYGIELAFRLEGTGVTINILNPGIVNTNIMRGAKNPPLFVRLFGGLMVSRAKPVEEYIPTVLRFATSPELDGVSGGFWGPKGKVLRISSGVSDTNIRRALWTKSEQVVKPYLQLIAPQVLSPQ